MNIYNSFRQLGQKADIVFLRTGNPSGPAGVIGRQVDGKWVQIATNRERAVVESGGRYYDAFTGPAGQLIEAYKAAIQAGMSAFPVRCFQ